MGNQNNALNVDTEEFLAGLRLTKAFRSLGAGILSFEGGMLKVQFRDFYFTAHATGRWYGEATIPATFFRNLRKSPPYGKTPLPVVYEQGQITIGTATTRCKWRAIDPPTIELPPGASMPEILVLSIRHSPEHIARSGLSDIVARAEQRRDELLDQVASTLEPLGIRADDLRRCLEETMQRKTDACAGK